MVSRGTKYIFIGLNQNIIFRTFNNDVSKCKAELSMKLKIFDEMSKEIKHHFKMKKTNDYNEDAIFVSTTYSIFIKSNYVNLN